MRALAQRLNTQSYGISANMSLKSFVLNKRIS